MGTKHVDGKSKSKNDFHRAKPETPSIESYAAQLSLGDVNEIDLDEALIKQPELFYNVADALAIAMSERDGAKLDFESAVAEEDGRLRVQAERKEEKLTEAGIRQLLAANPKLQELESNRLRKKLQADRWEALHAAYKQRSYALSALNDRAVARMSGGKDSAYDNLAASRREAAGRERRRMRGADG